MSNMSPQTHDLNDGTWGNLEDFEADDLANAFDGVWIICGPIFDSTPLILSSGVPVPSRFYKIIVDEENGTARVLPLMMDHGTPRTQSYDQFLTTVNAIQTRTGLEFFPELSPDEQQRLRRSRPRKIWKFPNN